MIIIIKHRSSQVARLRQELHTTHDSGTDTRSKVIMVPLLTGGHTDTVTATAPVQLQCQWQC